MSLLTLVKHLPGKHNQHTHNPHKGSGSAFSAISAEGINFVDKAADDFLLQHTSYSYEKFDEDLISEEDRIASKKAIVKSLSEKTGYPEDVVNDAVAQWAMSSNDNSYASMELQEAASKEFGVKLSHWQRDNLASVRKSRAWQEKMLEHGTYKTVSKSNRSVFEDEYKNLRVNEKSTDIAARKFVRAMYDHTQEKLAEAGIKQVALHRGIKTEEQLTKGDVTKINGNAMESWTTGPATADAFAGFKGVVLSASIPADRIIGSAATGFGCLVESEFVVLGGKGMGEAVVTKGNSHRDDIPFQFSSSSSAVQPEWGDEAEVPDWLQGY